MISSGRTLLAGRQMTTYVEVRPLANAGAVEQCDAPDRALS